MRVPAAGPATSFPLGASWADARVCAARRAPIARTREVWVRVQRVGLHAACIERNLCTRTMLLAARSSLAVLAFVLPVCTAGCRLSDCAAIPCPAPGFDPDACKCRPPAPLAGQSALGSPDAGSSALPAEPSVEFPQCSWPSELASSDSTSRDVCHAARAWVSCQLPGGGSQGCLSNDPTRCPSVPGLGAQPRSDGVSNDPLACRDQCATDQYAVACGGVGPGAVPEPPEGCTFAGAVPAGIAYYCCPCQ